MSLVKHLVAFGLSQVVDGIAEPIADAVERRFTDHGQALPKALNRANDRAWQALGVALAGDGLLDRIKVFFASGDDRGIREQVELFLKSSSTGFGEAPLEFRQSCLVELKQARKAGLLSAENVPPGEVARRAADFRRYTEPHKLVEEAQRASSLVGEALAERCPNLARLLRTPTPGGPPLLPAAFAYFFRREVETDDELAHGLFFDGLRQLAGSQARAFGEVRKALDSMGDRFDLLFEQLGRIADTVEKTHATATATHEAVLDVQAELARLAQAQSGGKNEVCALLTQVIRQLSELGMQRGEVRPQHSLSIRGADERRAVQALLMRYRQLSREEQRQAPALLNGLGKLQLGAGDFAGAGQSFAEVARIAPDATAQAEAHANAYRAALERRDYPTALAELRGAAELDAGRFAPFPLYRYEPRQVLGAGGFGTALLCRDNHFDEDVVVKTLHTGCLDRAVEELFREARILRRLTHPAIIGVRDCDYADPVHKARPYLVMDYFSGGNLQQLVDEQGSLPLEQLLVVAAQVAAGMKAAHAQGVLHRDLKPANILVRPPSPLPPGRGAGGEGGWKVKIIDFGLALRQQTVETSMVRVGSTERSMLDTSVAGTLDYAPPEQLGKRPGVPPGPYSDVFAFARTCCYALFQSTELRRKQWEGLPRPLADLLESCLDPDPRQRPQDFEQVLAVLGASLRQGDESRRREGEEQLRQVVRASLERTGGKPEAGDTARAREVCRQYDLPAERGNEVIREVLDGWRKEQQQREIGRRAQEAPPGRLIVSAGGDGTHRTITDALRAAAPGAEVRIRPGVYREGIVLKQAVSLVGEGPVEQIIVENDQGNCLLMAADRATVRGLTLRGAAGRHGRLFYTVDIPRGCLVLEGCDISSDSLACIAIHGNGTNPTIRLCKVHDSSEGGGVLIWEQAGGTIEHCDICANKFAGIELKQGSTTVVRNCRLHGSREGGGLFITEQGRGTFEACDIFGNKLAGVGISRGSSPVVRNCKVHDSTTGGGVFVTEQGSGTVERCDLYGNKFAGVEVVGPGSDLTVRDCRINRNGVAGVRVAGTATATVENCDLTGNNWGPWDISGARHVNRRGNRE